MGLAAFRSVPLADTASSVQQFISVFVGVYVLCILVYVLLSWVPVGASSAFERARSFLHEVCEPYLRLFRRIVPQIGPLDLSPMVAVLVLVVGEQLVNQLIGEIL